MTVTLFPQATLLDDDGEDDDDGDGDDGEDGDGRTHERTDDTDVVVDDDGDDVEDDADGGDVRGRDGLGEFHEPGTSDACDDRDVGVLLRAFRG